MSIFSVRLALLAGAVWFLTALRCHADIIPGVDWYVEKAELILLVRAQTAREAAAFPPPDGQQRLLVVEVLKDVCTDQYLEVPASTVPPGDRAVLLVADEGGVPWQPAINPKPWTKKTTYWLVDDQDRVKTGSVPARSTGKFPFGDAEVTLQTIRADIAASSPDETGLSAQVVDACLFPDRTAALERKDPRRAHYVRMMAILRDLDRDVPSLAALLEAPDKPVRVAAQAKLQKLTQADVNPVKEDSPRARHTSADAWRNWWQENRPTLAWDEQAGAWTKQAKALPWPRRWPTLPKPLKHPADSFPPDLLQALAKDDLARFAGAFRRWLDAGVLRDRQLVAAAQPFQITAAILPRLRLAVLNDKLAPAERMKTIALGALRWHHDRFAAERAEAKKLLEAGKMDIDLVRRAAFWELRDTNVNSPGRVAVELLAGNAEVESQQVLAALFLAEPTDALLAAGRTSVARGHDKFAAVLLQYAKDHRDNAAGWACWTFCLEKKPIILPVMADWLKDPSAEARARAAHNLSFFPQEEAVPALLAAIKKEKDDKTRARLLVALAQTGDKRGLDVLLAAATPDQEKELQIELARGLGRIQDKRALPALAEMATRSTDDQLSWEVVNAFGYVSGLFKGYAPHNYFSGGGIEPARLKEGLEAIARWRQQQKPGER